MSLARNVRTLAALHLALLLATSVLFYAWSGTPAALAAACGGGIATVNIGLLLWRRRRVDRGRALSAGESIRQLYRSALERFFAVVALFWLGMAVLELPAAALLTGFVVGQVALLFIREQKEI